MLGRKTITPPTPPITPSINKSFNAPSGMYFPIILPRKTID